MNKDHDRTKNAVSSNRRQVVKATLAVPPILATLTSRPVQAVQGLSNMMSGNTSSCRGDEFYGGMSPGFWKTPLGPTQPAWSQAGYLYGVLISGEKGNQWDQYTGGTTLGETDVSELIAWYSDLSNVPLREILNKYDGKPIFHLIAGLLNINYYKGRYFITLDQFKDRLKNPDSLASLISQYYEGSPGDTCLDVT